MFKYLNIRDNKGFSVIEVLATALVFSMAVTSIVGILTRSLQLQRRATATQKIQENAMFVLEYMTREIRVSSIANQDSNCTATVLNLNHPTSGSITYSLSNGSVTRTVGGVTGILSSNDIQFSGLVFCIKGSALGDNLPTRVTIIATISDRSTRPLASVALQTTIDSRNIAN